MSRKTVVSFKIDPGEKAWLQDLADEQGLTLSELCAVCIREAFAEAPEDGDEDLAEESYWEPESVGEEDPAEDEPAAETVDIPDFLAALDLPLEHRQVITDYLYTAAWANETTKADILARMLAVAVADYGPGRANFWTSTIGNVNLDELLTKS